MKKILNFLVLLFSANCMQISAQSTLYTPAAVNLTNNNFNSNSLSNWTRQGHGSNPTNYRWSASNNAILFTPDGSGTSYIEQSLPSNIAFADGYYILEFDVMFFRSGNSSTLNLVLSINGSSTTNLIEISHKPGQGGGGGDFNKNITPFNGVLVSSPVDVWANLESPTEADFNAQSTKFRLKIPQTIATSGALRFTASSSNNNSRIWIDNINIVTPQSVPLATSCPTCMHELVPGSNGTPATTDVRPLIECKTNDENPYTYTYYLPAVAELPTDLPNYSIGTRNTAVNAMIQITSEASDAVVKIIRPNGTLEATLPISAGQNITYSTPYDSMFVAYTGTPANGYNAHTNPNYNVNYNNRGYVIESNQPVTVRWIADQQNNRLAVVLRNTDVLGKVFRAASVKNTPMGVGYEGKHYITVMATEDNTKVQVAKTPTARVFSEFVEFTLNKYEQRTFISDTSVSGRLILADKPITVVSGQQHKRIIIGNNSSSSNVDYYPSHAQEGTIIQLKPVYALSNENLSIVAGSTTATVARGGYQVVAAYDNTDVHYGDVLVAKLNAGESYQAFYSYGNSSVGAATIVETSKPAYVYDIGSNLQGEFEMYTAPAIDRPLGKASLVKIFSNQGNFGWVIVDVADINKVTRNGTLLSTIATRTTTLVDRVIYYFSNNFAPLTTNDFVCQNCDYMYVGQMADGGNLGSQVGYVSSFDGAPLQFYNTELLPALILTNGYVIDTLNYFVNNSGLLTHKLTIASTGGTQVIIDSIKLSRTGGRNPGSVRLISNPQIEFTLNLPPANTVSRGTEDVVNATVYVNDGVQNAAICLSYVIMNFNPLPVSLMSFDAIKEGHTALVKWETGNERDNKGFMLQRSSNGKDWYDLTWVNSKAHDGNSDLINKYSYVDFKPLSGINYYRLIQHDYSGSVSYSEVKSVEFDGVLNTITIYPNPTNGSISVDGVMKGSALYVFNASGQIVGEYNVGEHKTIIELSSLSPGVYMLQATDLLGNINFEKVIRK